MAARNYQPTLRRLAHAINTFIARYQALLLQGMTSEQATALSLFQVALDDLITQLGNPHGD